MGPRSAWARHENTGGCPDGISEVDEGGRVEMAVDGRTEMERTERFWQVEFRSVPFTGSTESGTDRGFGGGHRGTELGGWQEAVTRCKSQGAASCEIDVGHGDWEYWDG